LLAAAKEEKSALDQWASRAARRGLGQPASEGERAKLLPPRPAGRRLGPLPETEETRERDNGGMLLLNADKMKQQDQEVTALGEIVRRQKELALRVNEEIEAQAPMVDHLHDLVDTHNRKLAVANRRAKNL
jgi:regulator of vacuolar morphogenesis